ncbi:hypothetical protein P4V41_07560 [Fictibacillus nanhaiensis]|uniref:hypothetical protein n=1 Tax=Fictibacillus nanhaiensis TaxID=742169 RepID=UPI002E219BCA|nr:hypothetical protein [Fictibacillus nanhaiensis]
MDIKKPMTKQEIKLFRRRVDSFLLPLQNDVSEMLKYNFEQLLQRIEYLQDKNVINQEKSK